MPLIEEYDYITYLNYFKGREDHFACQGSTHYYPINRPLSEYYLQKHFDGSATFGIYVLTSESTCHFVCLDIDVIKQELDRVDITNRKEKLKHLRDKLMAVHELLTEKLGISGDAVLLEDTGGRGFHVWVFFSDPLSGEIAIRFYNLIKRLLSFDFEFFPKQDMLSQRRKLGNLIKLPLGVHQKYSNRSIFLKLIDPTAKSFNSHVDNLEHLRSITKLPSGMIQEIVERHSDQINAKASAKKFLPDELQAESRRMYVQDFDFLFGRCKALRSLKSKCDNQVQLSRVEAFHLCNLLLSVRNGHDLLIELIRKSYGDRFSLDTTQKEMDNINPLYPSSCAALIRGGICEGYCTDQIERTNKDPLLPNTNPISFWLNPTRVVKLISEDQLSQEISNPDNVMNTYWQLRRYHKHEDVGFFDEFDYGYFEDNLEAYSKYIARTLSHKKNIPLIGYLDINIPKKVDENNKMQYRPMVYSSIFDQIIIQTIFSAVGPLVEAEFQDSSYGYRLNLQNPESGDIFNDWREYYPKFRAKGLSLLRTASVKYYICCDIQGFYDHVVHKTLIEQLKGIVHDPYIVETIKRFIELYFFEKNGHTGMPQGPAYARVLANLYLNKFDTQMAGIGAGYLRYVDDLFFFFQEKASAEAGLVTIVKALDELGLS
ncbi:MAG: reverse transcriptase domain-containing protein, partial [Proteobacteria bacterium]|nr:reverse transcriptase domain-containing protein [Pseudomonadota bacterium]